MMVPLTIHYVSTEKYGIWLTISSIIAWFSFFDIGLGNGLKNKLAQALANNDQKLAKVYISTTYAILTLLVTLFIVVFFVFNHFATWTSLLSLPSEMENELKQLVVIVFIFFCFQFILQTVVVVLTAHQQVSMASFLAFLGNLLSLVIIAILTRTTDGSLLNLGVAYSAAPLVVFLVASIFYFRTSFRNISPDLKSVDFKHSRPLMGLGLKFFIIQIAAIILYQTTNIILVKLYGPNEVSAYNIVYKYFGIITMVFSIVMTPFWVAFSEAYFKDDIGWIKDTVKKLIRLWMLVLLAGLIMLFFSRYVINLWVGDAIEYKFSVGIAMFLYFITSALGSIFVFFINGSGKVFLQFLFSIITPILFIPLAIFLGKSLGIMGVITASILCNIYGIVIAPVQYSLIINKKAKGLWDR